MNLVCEQVRPDVLRCRKKAIYGCRFEKIAICEHCFLYLHSGGDHEKITKEDVLTLVSIQQALVKIMDLKGKISASGSDIIGFVSQIIENIEMNLIDKEKTLLGILTGAIQKIPDFKNFPNLSYRLNNKDEILNAIQYHFNENDGDVYQSRKELKDEIVSLKNSLNILKTDNTNVKKYREKLRDEIKILNNSLSILESENTKLKKEKGEINNKIDDLNNSLMKLQRENVNLSKDRNEKQIKIDTLFPFVSSLEMEKSKMRNEIKGLQDKIGRLDYSFIKLKEENTSILKIKEKMENEINLMKNSLKNSETGNCEKNSENLNKNRYQTIIGITKIETDTLNINKKQEFVNSNSLIQLNNQKIEKSQVNTTSILNFRKSGFRL